MIGTRDRWTSRLWLTAGGALLLVAALASPALASSQERFTFVFDGLERSFLLTIPDGYASGDALPLVLSLHGAASDGEAQRALSGFDAAADARGVFVAYPDGVGGTWNAGLGFSDADDVGFLVEVVDRVAADYGIDTGRVFTCGMSQGGFMSFRLACERPDRLAAAGSVTGLMYQDTFTQCEPSSGVPVISFQGTEDFVVPYGGIPGFFPGVVDVVQLWIEANGCARTASVTDIPDRAPADGSTATRYLFGDCADGPVVHYRIDGGGHTWPGSFPLPFLGSTNRDVDATRTLTEFFLTVAP